eukprot:TRINITY_DN8790_c0_g1_i1.p1 TRINITY_DN8790_c0_g1~~TRINITY_DN8790_c0_g1_i1.p1  ORF type:complete len:489 (+),score=143.16 TRINITY_DN8790_c0_g1_i1:134-1600(+)
MDQLKELENLVTQFYGSESSNKQQIESVLNQLKKAPNAVQSAQYFLTNSQNQYAIWFAVLMLDDVLASGRWNSLPKEEKVKVRHFLFQFLVAKFRGLPQFVSNKLSQVVVDIARIDWPQEYPEFFQDLQALCSTGETCTLGIYMIKLVSEEFTSSREDLLSTRKRELKDLLSQMVPSILGQLSQILETLFNQNTSLLAASPQIARKEEGMADLGMVSNNFTKETRTIARLCLEALQHLITWIPINQVFTPSIFEIVFKYIKLNDSNSVLALSLLNEIFEKNFIPKEYQSFLGSVFKQIFSFLQIITMSPISLGDSDGEFLSKLIRFTHLFVSNHFTRVEDNSSFPVIQFLSLLFKFTLMQVTLDSFLSCLEIWEDFIDHVAQKEVKDANAFNLVRQRYFDCFMSLMQEVIKKSSFSLNWNELNELDDTVETTKTSELEPDSETVQQSELESLTSSCINIAYKISQLYPDQALEALFPLFTQNCTRTLR